MHPTFLESGHYSIPTYGVLAALGLIFGLLISVRLCRRDHIDEEKAWNLGMMVIIAGVLGAKALLITSNWEFYSQHADRIFSIDMLRAGGVWYGAVLGGLGAAGIYIWRAQLPLLRLTDAFAPGISLGHAMGRLGCLAAGCCYGRPTLAPWGIVFTDPVAHRFSGTPLGVPLHPTQLYEAGAEMIIFATLMWLFPRRTFSGQVAGAYAFLYGVARFCIEFFRGDEDRGTLFHGALSTSQGIAIVMVIVGGLLWLRRRPPALTQPGTA